MATTITLTEKDIQRQIMQYLAYHPKVAMSWRQNSGSVRILDPKYPNDPHRYLKVTWNYKGDPVNGISDIIGVLNDGRFLAIEVKGPKGKPTKAQQFFVDQVNEAGGLAFISRSLEDVEERLNEIQVH